jgi:hypothetical protein
MKYKRQDVKIKVIVERTKEEFEKRLQEFKEIIEIQYRFHDSPEYYIYSALIFYKE